MATALQSTTINLPPQMGANATYAWSPAKSQLYAAGGCHADMIYCWDLQQEVCSSLVRDCVCVCACALAGTCCVDGVNPMCL